MYLLNLLNKKTSELSQLASPDRPFLSTPLLLPHRSASASSSDSPAAPSSLRMILLSFVFTAWSKSNLLIRSAEAQNVALSDVVMQDSRRLSHLESVLDSADNFLQANQDTRSSFRRFCPFHITTNPNGKGLRPRLKQSHTLSPASLDPRLYTPPAAGGISPLVNILLTKSAE